MIYLQNEGELELIAIETMGIHAKENENPIGFFGTGLKYAIAVFLREKIDIKIFIGENEFTFDSENINFRGGSFDLCKMIGPQDQISLGFTTELGKGWKLWQAYREIHSNCLDESGSISKEKVSPKSGYTTVQLDLDLDIEDVFLNKENKTLLFSNKELEIYEGENDKVYYKGIRAKNLNEASLYTYNVLRDCTLTEDRLICYDWQLYEAINKAVTTMEDKEIITNVVSSTKGLEAHTAFNSNTYNDPSPQFLEVLGEIDPDELNSDVKRYVEKHTEIEVPSEDKANFLKSLETLCDKYGVYLEQQTIHLITLSEGILDD